MKLPGFGSDSLEILDFERHVRALPGDLKFSPNPFRVGGLLLGLQTLQKAKQRPGISRVLLQIGAKYCFGLGGLAALQQRAAE